MNQYKQTSCPICYTQYSPGYLNPVMICIRQHHICSQCAEALKKEIRPLCYVCREVIEKEKWLPFRMMIEHMQSLQQIQSHFNEEKRNFVQEIEAKIKSTVQIHQNKLQLQLAQQNLLAEKQMAQFKLIADLKLRNMSKVIKQSSEKSIRAKRFHEVIKQFKQLIEIDPELHYNASNKLEFLGLGCYLDRKYLTKIQNYVWDCMRKVKQRQTTVNIFDLLSLCLLECSYFEEDKKWYEKMLQAYPNNTPILYGLALLYHNIGDSQIAKQIYAKLIQLENGFDKPYQMLAFLEYQKGQHTKAKGYAEQAVKNNNKNIYANYIIAMTIGDVARQIQILESILFYQSKFIRVNFQLGLRQFIIKDYQAALGNFIICKRSGQKYQKICLYIAKAMFYLDDFKGASQEILSVKYEQNQDEAQRCFYLALIKSKISSSQSDIIEYFQKSIQLNPLQSEFYSKFVDYLENQGKYEKAIDILKSQLAIFPRKCLISKKIGITYLKLSKFNEAIDWFQIYRAESSDDQLYYYFGEAYFQLSQYDIALNNFYKCLQLNVQPITKVRQRVVETYKKKSVLTQLYFNSMSQIKQRMIFPYKNIEEIMKK